MQSGKWTAQADQMQKLRQRIMAAEHVGPDAGIFGSVVLPYQEACAQVAAWCGQGQQQMAAIASALRAVTEKYANADEKSVFRVGLISKDLANEKIVTGGSKNISGLINRR